MASFITFFSWFKEQAIEEKENIDPAEDDVKLKRSRAEEILIILTNNWEVAAYIMRARHMTERDEIFGKYMERGDLLCDQL